MEAVQWAIMGVIFLCCIAAGLCLVGLRCRPGKALPHPAAAQLLVGLLLSVELAGLLLLVWRRSQGGAVTAAIMLLFLAYFLPVSILPEDADVLWAAGPARKSGPAACFWSSLLVLAVFGGWEGWLFHSGAGPAELIFTAAFLLMGIAGCHVVCLWAQKRFEALVDKQYQQELLNFMQIIRSQRHDFSFHMQAVAGMIERQEYEECAQYVRRITYHVASLNEVLPLADPVVSALLNTFSAIAAEKGVRLEFQLLDPLREPPCTGYELNTIIGNLLQNALDEVERYDGDRRWIQLLIMKRSRKYFIKVSNPCDREPAEFEAIFKPGYTTKQTHEGIGLVTVRRLTEKYGGGIYLEYKSGVVHFIARLPAGGAEIKR